MNYLDKTKGELINELQKLHKEYGSLKKEYLKEITECKQTEEALKESEKHYRRLFNAIDEGFCIIEVIFDESENPIDYRFLEINPSFEKQTGLINALGKRMRELAPNHEEHWFEIYGKIAITGQPVRFENRAEQLHRWYDVYAFRLGRPEDRQVAILFNDITKRKHVEREMNLYGEIMKNISEGINLIRVKDEVIVFTNPKFDEMFGYEHGELIGKHVSILNAPTSRSPEETKQEIVDSVKRTGEWHGEILNQKKNGDHFWSYVNVSIFDHPDYGKVFLSVHSDITERKQTESSLRESEAKFRTLFENTLLGISIARPDGGNIMVNQAYARMYGYENPEMMLAEVSDTGKLFANPEEKNEVLQTLRKNGFMEAREFELIRRDGSHFFVLVSACEIRDTEGNLLYNQATHIDLTERKKYEDQMHSASLHSRNLIEASLDPLCTINAEGKITDVNSSAEQITGITRDKLIGSSFADYFTEPDKVRKGFKIILSKGLVKNIPLTIFHSSGRTTDVLFNATLFKNETGEVQGVFAAARDITERKKMEEELRKSMELLGKLNQHLHDIRENERAFISREIHDELGQSMTALKLDLKRMYKYVDTNSEANLQLDNMIELVSDTIKDLQRISSDLRPGILDDLGLVSAIEWYCEEFEKRTGIKCNLKLDDSEYSDSQVKLTFFRVLQETLTNVIRHANASSVTIKLHQTKKGTTLSILDNGIGITREKVESSKSLGLIGMRERVRHFGGKVDISSTNGYGTKLTIFIPS